MRPAEPRSAPALWESQARQWALLGHPLRPSEQDLAWVQDSIDERSRTGTAGPTVLILGVTPELAARRWPDGSTVLATDVSREMIRSVWPDTVDVVRRWAAQADWLALPLAGASCDLVLSDCGFANVPGVDVAALAASIRRVLRPDGVVTTRMFVRPDEPERADEVWNHLLDGRIGSFAAFKLRLLMALCRDDGDVRVADGWEWFRSRCPDLEGLAAHLAWPPAEIRTIEAYRGQDTVYWFPTLAQFRAAIAPAFDERACRWPTYELGERCPTFVLQ